ncbi:MAG: amidohydrolase family protein [Atribacterota bacterium]|nr:amidohydrolase family protein [Atribacterota bacterium]
MKRVDMIIRGGNLIISHEGIIRGDILIYAGKIVGISSGFDLSEADVEIDGRGKYVFPGIIDVHAHYGLGSPDDFPSETRSAALGGVTTVITFLNSPNRYSQIFIPEKEKAEKQSYIDFSYHICLMKDEQLEEIPLYVEKYGISSFKFFMNFRGDEGKSMGVEGLDDGFLYEGFKKISQYPRAKALIHAENIEICRRFQKQLKEEGRDGLEAWNQSRPSFLEAESIQRACYLAKVVNCPLYIAHVTSKKGCEELNAFHKKYNQINAETCAHYLTHTVESSIGNIGKVNPPLRYPEDLEYLWESLKNGTLDVISSDHVPRKVATKKGSIWECSLGFPGTATLLSIALSEGYHKRGLSLERIAELLSENPAKLFNMYPRKGSLQVGSDADLTIVDLNLKKKINSSELGSFSDYSLYDGWMLTGWPVITMVRGKIIMQESKIMGESGYGKFITRF